MNLIVIDLHPLHQGADQRSSAGPVCVLQPVVHLCGKILESPDDQVQFWVQGSCICQLVGLLFEFRYPLSSVRTCVLRQTRAPPKRYASVPRHR
jgi:hypothetical protein